MRRSKAIAARAEWTRQKAPEDGAPMVKGYPGHGGTVSLCLGPALWERWSFWGERWNGQTYFKGSSAFTHGKWEAAGWVGGHCSGPATTGTPSSGTSCLVHSALATVASLLLLFCAKYILPQGFSSLASQDHTQPLRAHSSLCLRATLPTHLSCLPVWMTAFASIPLPWLNVLRAIITSDLLNIFTFVYPTGI